MMRLWAPNATFTFGPGRDGGGEGADPAGLAEDEGVQAREPLGLRTTPRTSSKVTVNGDRGTVHFECHFVDARRARWWRSPAADLEVARIDGRWLITNMVGSTTELSPEAGGQRRRRSRRQQPAAKNAAAEPCATIRSSAPSGGYRPRSTPSCWWRSWARRCWSSRSGRARAARARAVERAGGDARHAPGASLRLREAAERRPPRPPAARPRTSKETSTRSCPVVGPGRIAPAGLADRPGDRERGRADPGPRPSPTASASSLRPRTSASSGRIRAKGERALRR